MPKVLVTDASERAALAVIRSLGRRNIEVTAADSTRFSMGFMSKYCKQRILYPSPETEKTRFARALLKKVRDESFDALIPITDMAMVPIVERKEDFEQYTKVAAPDLSTATKVLDKIETLKIARQQDLPCPATTFGENIDDAHRFSKEIVYPVVVRPRRKVTWIGEKALILKVTSNNYAYDYQDFITKWAKLVLTLKKVGLDRDFLLVQEFIPGQGFGLEALMHEGRPKATFVHKRLREYPVTGGASTLRESAKDDRLARLGIKLLAALQWDGVAMVEFRLNRSTGEPMLIEVNGRFWGSLPLAIRSGVDFPYLLYKLLIGTENLTNPEYEAGIKQRWLAGDFLWLYSSLVNGGRRAKSIKEFLCASTVPDDIMTLDDSAPFCNQMLFVLSLLADVSKGHRSLTGEVIP